MITIQAAKNNFFDRKVVIDAVDRATLRVLSKFGAFVRRRAKSSIRKRKKASKPGQPPSSHVGLLKDLIFFAWDSSAKQVVIGPTLINRPTGAPETLEYGGDAELPTSQFRTRGGKVRFERTTKRIHIQPRPYMNPALQAELPGLPAMWANSVR